MSDYPTIQIRVDKHIKDDFFELCKLKGSTVSIELKNFINTELSDLPRIKRNRKMRENLPRNNAEDDFLA